MCSLFNFTRNGNHGLLKRKKVTILHLAVFIYCISVFFVCIVKNSHNKQCCDVIECGVLNILQLIEKTRMCLGRNFPIWICLHVVTLLFVSFRMLLCWFSNLWNVVSVYLLLSPINTFLWEQISTHQVKCQVLGLKFFNWKREWYNFFSLKSNDKRF